VPFAVVEVVAPAEQPVSLARAKDHLRVSGTDEDAIIVDMIAGAARSAQRECGLQLVTATLKLVLDDFPRFWLNGLSAFPGCWTDDGYWAIRERGIIRLPVGPVQSVTSIQYTDTAGVVQTMSAADYSVGAATGRVMPKTGWPVTSANTLENVSVTYLAGFGAASAVPMDAVAAILLILADRYQNRGDELSAFHADREIPAGARRLLRNLSNGDQW
jgi:hypothetical protein